MFFYRQDYAIEKVLKSQKSNAQICLEQFSGKHFEKKEAEVLWNRIVDHKWYVSERLQRDIGFKTATVDFFENFYEESKVNKNRN
ncbi:MAG: DUF4032 domain-containing protein, partial [Pyrinomonadaceae bacterium]|nr:DUF4032 domain-containing protein [Pyrinomonadaceae bacterium]